MSTTPSHHTNSKDWFFESDFVRSIDALWLGHESPMTTHMYVEADLSMKALALARLQEPEATTDRYQASDAH